MNAYRENAKKIASKRRAQVAEMHKSMSLGEIGRKLGISRARAHQLYWKAVELGEVTA